MTLDEWLAPRPRGARAKLVRDAETSFSTVAKAMKRVPLDRRAATRISAATNGDVSVAELMLPPPLKRTKRVA